MAEGHSPPRMAHDPEHEDRAPYLDERQTLAFLSERGAALFKPGQPMQPLLYVLKEGDRSRAVPERGSSKKPSIARLDAPTGIEQQQHDPESGSSTYGITNDPGGRVDYYTIDARTGAVELVRTTRTRHDSEYPYLVHMENLFVAHDALFPKGTD